MSCEKKEIISIVTLLLWQLTMLFVSTCQYTERLWLYVSIQRGCDFRGCCSMSLLLLWQLTMLFVSTCQWLLVLVSRESLFTGLNYWTELLDWTTGPAQMPFPAFFSVGKKLIMSINLTSLLNLPLACWANFAGVNRGQRSCLISFNEKIRRAVILNRKL